MILYLIVILSVVSVTLDLLILRRIRRRLPDKRWLRRLYLAHFLLLDAGIVAALLFYRCCSEAGAESYMHVILWVICLFFMSVGPKSVYMLVSLLDYPAGWVRRKKGAVVFEDRSGGWCADPARDDMGCDSRPVADRGGRPDRPFG